MAAPSQPIAISRHSSYHQLQNHGHVDVHDHAHGHLFPAESDTLMYPREEPDYQQGGHTDKRFNYPNQGSQNTQRQEFEHSSALDSNRLNTEYNNAAVSADSSALSNTNLHPNTAEPISLSPPNGGIHPYPILIANSGSGSAGSYMGFGSFGSLGSGGAASFGSRFYSSASPGFVGGPLDPNNFRCRLSSSIENEQHHVGGLSTERTISRDVASREGEWCRGYQCCGISLADLHALVEHFEDAHVVVVDAMGNFYHPQNLNGERMNTPIGGNFTLDLNSITSLQIQQDGAQGESISSLTANGELSMQGLQDLQNLLASSYPDSTASLALASAMTSLRQQQGQQTQPQQPVQQTPVQGRVSPANTISSTHSSPSLFHTLSSSLAGALGSQPAQPQTSTGLTNLGSQFEPSSQFHPHSQRRTGSHNQNNMSMVGGPVDPDEMELEMEMGTGFVDSSEGSESSSDVHSVHSYPSSTHSSPQSGSEDIAYNGLTSGVNGMNVSGLGIGGGLYRSPSISQGQGNEGTTLKAEPMIHTLAGGIMPSTSATANASSTSSTPSRIYTSGAMFNSSPNPPAVPPPTPITPGGTATPMGPSAFDTTMILHNGIGPSISDRMGFSANINLSLNSGSGIKHSLHTTSGHPYLSKGGYGGSSGFGLRGSSNFAYLGRGGPSYSTNGLASNLGMSARGMQTYGNTGFNANDAFYGSNATESHIGAIKPSLLYTPSHGKAKKLSRSASAHSSAAGSAVPSRSNSPPSKVDRTGTPSTDVNGKVSGPGGPVLTTPSILSKPFKCPKPGCMKSYKQANGLKYHVTHGSCSFTPPAELAEVEGLSEREAEKRLKPFCCQVPPCQRRYKNMNGLRYHYQHSGEHGAVGLALLASGNHDATKSQPSPPSISLDTSSGALDTSGPTTPSSVIGASLSRANSTSSASIHRGRASPSSPALAYPQSHSQPITPLTSSFGGPSAAHFANSVLSQPPSAYASPWASPRTGGYTALPPTGMPQQQSQIPHNSGAMGPTYTTTTMGGTTSGAGWGRQDLALS